MGSNLSRAVAGYRTRNDRRVLLLGLSGAGKSAIIAHIREQLPGATAPALRDVSQFDVQPMVVGKCTFRVWDIGGKEALRPFWRHHYLGTQGVVFVVDATDRASLPTAAAELKAAAGDVLLTDSAFLVLAHKSDLSGAMTAAELGRTLNLPAVLLGHPWHVQASSVVSGDGLASGWAFLLQNTKALA
jgi:GTPase SAR1 family protein